MQIYRNTEEELATLTRAELGEHLRQVDRFATITIDALESARREGNLTNVQIEERALAKLEAQSYAIIVQIKKLERAGRT